MNFVDTAFWYLFKVCYNNILHTSVTVGGIFSNSNAMSFLDAWLNNKNYIRIYFLIVHCSKNVLKLSFYVITFFPRKKLQSFFCSEVSVWMEEKSIHFLYYLKILRYGTLRNWNCCKHWWASISTFYHRYPILSFSVRYCNISILDWTLILHFVLTNPI